MSKQTEHQVVTCLSVHTDHVDAMQNDEDLRCGSCGSGSDCRSCSTAGSG